MEIPILINHEPQKPIGRLEVVDGKFFVEFLENVKITKNYAFEIFGNAGIKILEYDELNNEYFIRKAEIIEFSLANEFAKIACGEKG